MKDGKQAAAVAEPSIRTTTIEEDLCSNQAFLNFIYAQTCLTGTRAMLFKRSGVDRRTGVDRRQVYSIDYFIQGGIERRSGLERRKKRGERRKGWVRINQWISVPVKS